MVAAGKRDRLITFQTSTETRSATGAPVKTWANLASNPQEWAQVMPLSQRELAEQSSIIMTADDRAFIINFRSDITPLMRVVFEGRNYDVHSVREATENGFHDSTRIVGRHVQ